MDMNETPKVVLSSTGVDVGQWEDSTAATGDGARGHPSGKLAVIYRNANRTYTAA